MTKSISFQGRNHRWRSQGSQLSQRQGELGGKYLAGKHPPQRGVVTAGCAVCLHMPFQMCAAVPREKGGAVGLDMCPSARRPVSLSLSTVHSARPGVSEGWGPCWAAPKGGCQPAGQHHLGPALQAGIHRWELPSMAPTLLIPLAMHCVR